MLKKKILQKISVGMIIASIMGVTQVRSQEIDETMPGSIPKEIVDDWKSQDGVSGGNYDQAISKIKSSLPSEYSSKITGTGETGYLSACHWRRVYRIKQFPFLKKIMFTKHHNRGNIAIGFWVNVGSRDVTDNLFQANGSLCLLEFQNYYSQFKEILKKNDACIIDPCISFDAKKVIFAMSGNGSGTGYRLFEMKIDDPNSVKQLTFNPSGLTVTDFEPCYLPNGDIVFASTRCYGVIDCGWQPTTNMFLMDSTGKYIRQVGFDQVHTFYPVLRPNGTVMYTRWEYNDRDIANIAGLFVMNPDGTGQTELYGNQTTWPMNIFHGRPVPGNPNKYFAIAGGHHGHYCGEVMVIDISKGSNGPDKVKMVSPPRETKSLGDGDPVDDFAFGGVVRNSAYPYPLDEEWYLVSYRGDVTKPDNLNSYNHREKFNIYLKNIDGNSRELLAWSDQSLHHPVVVAPWKEIWGSEPPRVASTVNYNDSMGTFTMLDVYIGEGMKNVPRGTAKKLRVVAIKYRVSGACDNGWAGQVTGRKPSDVVFAAPDICPVSLWGGSWDAKMVLGEAKIYEDGSAAFKVPARTPVYFQVLDSNGYLIADMRSWATLQPGETFSCTGCHESKTEAPPAGRNPMASIPQELEKTLGVEDEGFEFPKFVQPILDKYCVSCHKSGHRSGFDLTGSLVFNDTAKKSYCNSYASLFKGIGASKSNKAINIATIFSQAPQMPAYSYGSNKSGLIKAINGGISDMKDLKITDKEKRILACWIDLEAPHWGSYSGGMRDNDAQRYQQLEATAKKWRDIELANIKELAALQKSAVLREKAKSNIVNNVKSLNIMYMPAERSLILRDIYQEGKLTLTDIRGRVVAQFNLSEVKPEGVVTISLAKRTLSSGLYVAKFEGENAEMEAKLSITQ